ncbi:hypothetical protein CFBP7900_40790 [Xanthomonas hortorum pv. carotae]|uniref:DNA (cytosine-5-)-methyltransferase n=1 Tax=Xanthomonas hortorum pv. carotae TaxID=487904 RepID=A0A6V7FJS9_9XANT|nr:hypothetical protein CFBP7900_40790 [Xanthomonas hortorum pv. carotae]CAD0363993.1 hypothetical protein CFBP7900_40790 [Xanthomonas hortorum pv. carotae]
MATSPRSKQKTSPKPKSGPAAGRAKTSATPTRTVKASKESAAGSSMTLSSLLQKHSLDGLSWKMSSGSSAPKGAKLLRQLPTSSKKSGIWGGGSRATLSMRVCPTTEKEYSLSQVIDPNPPISSFLTAANATGILRREERNGRKLDPIFEEGLRETIRFWSNAGEALGIPKQRILAPRFALKPEDIKAAIATDRFSVARNLTWDECEQLMGFPEGWTAVEGDSLATPSPRRSRSGSRAASSPLKKAVKKK